MGRHRLAFERYDIKRLGVVDERKTSLRGDQLGDLLNMLVGVRGREDESRRADAQICHLPSQRLAMIDDMVGTELGHPGLRFRARGCRNDDQLGYLASKLDCHRAYSAGTPDDQQRMCCTGYRSTHGQSLEEGLPRGDCRQRQRRCLCPIEANRLLPDNAFVDQVQLGVGPIAADAARVEHLVARFEAAHFRADSANDTGGIPTQDTPITVDRTRASAHLRVNRVYRDSLDLDEEITAGSVGIGKFDIDESFRAIDRSGLLVADCAHDKSYRQGLCSELCHLLDTHKRRRGSTSSSGW